MAPLFLQPCTKEYSNIRWWSLKNKTTIGLSPTFIVSQASSFDVLPALLVGHVLVAEMCASVMHLDVDPCETHEFSVVTCKYQV